jgi:hypothetical protein
MIKKNLFKISFALNLLLVALVFWLLRKSSPPQNISAATVSAEIISSPDTLKAFPGANASAFRWSQLESSDYHAYIANLRSIGCPEQTLHDIIAADVDEAFYASRREQLKQSGPASEYALQELNKEEAAFLDELLNGRTITPQVAANSPRIPKLRAKSLAEREWERPTSMPLILQPVDSDAANLTEVQKQTIGELRQQFQEEVGTNQDPNDPTYRQRWQTAQHKADDLLVGELGRNFILNYQAHVQNQAPQPGQ